MISEIEATEIETIQNEYHENPLNNAKSFYYRVYKALGGQMAEDDYQKNVEEFFRLTFTMWIGGDLPDWWDQKDFENSGISDERDFIWKKWTKYVSDYSADAADANRIFESIDTITAYT